VGPERFEKILVREEVGNSEGFDGRQMGGEKISTEPESQQYLKIEGLQVEEPIRGKEALIPCDYFLGAQGGIKGKGSVH